ncbi:MAG: hypothetical protein ACFFFB_22375, partial [Candidatus Heimdallarchaeota archaeon]
AKWFTLPAALYFFFKFLLNKDWKQIKNLLIYLGVPILVLLVSPLLYLPNYIDLYISWISSSKTALPYQPPEYVKLIIFGGIFLIYLILRLRKADLLEITFFSVIVMFSIMFWRRPYVRYLTPLVLYGHLKTNENIMTIDLNLKITRVHFRIGNHLFTYILSGLGCIVAIAIIIFVF